MYASKAEARYARYLDALVGAGKIVWWEPQPRFRLSVRGKKICDFVPDFRVLTMDDGMEYHEVKGHPTPVWRLKRKLFEALHPDLRYVVIPAREALAL